MVPYTLSCTLRLRQSDLSYVFIVESREWDGNGPIKCRTNEDYEKEY